MALAYYSGRDGKVPLDEGKSRDAEAEPVNASLPALGLYFCLSHPGSPAGIDHWTSVFYQDLRSEVARLARASSITEVGFADDQPPGADRDAAVMRALTAAQVIVPLYSPEYLAHQSTGRELAAFRQRIPPSLAQARPGHVQPVLWAPLHPGQTAEYLDRALELGAGYSDYAALGLGSMCRISRYREHYRSIVRRLAAQIVETAERRALSAAKAAELVEEPVPTPAADGLHFVVAVIAPKESELPQSRHPECYGPASYSWRPFRHAHEFPIAVHTSHEARRLNMPTRVIDFAAEDDALEVSPGVILVDPWVMALRNGGPLLRAAFAAVRQWVGLVVVVDHHDHQYGREVANFAKRVMRMRQVSQRSQLVSSEWQFRQVIPTVIARARRRYLSDGPSFPPPGPSLPRERLIGPNQEPPSGTGEY